MKPLLITYNGNNFSEEGEYNRDRMKKIFDADHLIISPSQDALIKLNRLGFEKVGDMNWHNHTGIMTVPMQYAENLQDTVCNLWRNKRYFRNL